MFSRSHKRAHTLDIWPGFVDALAALLMVIIFVLMAFVLSQLYLSYALSTREEALAQKNTQITTLNDKLRSEQALREQAKKQLEELLASFKALETRSGELEENLKKTTDEKELSLQQVAKLLIDMQALEGNLAEAKQASEKQRVDYAALLEKLSQKEGEAKTLTDELHKIKNSGFGLFRSEFLAKLQKVVGDRSDIRIVGDRFVFQSEVFFDRASADLGKEGKAQLAKLAAALKEIAAKIPDDVKWILRVDGHTDHRPIKNTRFPSNWDLSAARALSVVRFLISQGVAPEHLVAAGFGEFQPLVKETKEEKELARNRRIEFKLDQR